MVTMKRVCSGVTGDANLIEHLFDVPWQNTFALQAPNEIKLAFILGGVKARPGGERLSQGLSQLPHFDHAGVGIVGKIPLCKHTESPKLRLIGAEHVKVRLSIIFQAGASLLSAPDSFPSPQPY